MFSQEQLIKTAYRLLLGTAFFSLPALAQSDGQLWLSTSKSLYRSGNLSFKFYGETRLQDDGTDALGHFFGPTVSYRVKPWLNLGGAVKMIHFKSGDSFAKIRRPEIQATLKFKLLDRLSYSHRNRYEYFSREGRDDTERLRSRLNFSIPLKHPSLSKIYFGNEFFYRPDTGEWERNRLVPFGLTFKLPRKQSLSLFYMLEHIRRNSHDNHTLGINYSF
ncbi:DUF2490 domain-containing protein [Acanthopleuribacter pedis]|uniref:DUF2490 domain-containing protein n=1 Tax=Acanthopleuribacter pedis TaxID=442870 RepID=A0A8J7QS43_9BACT|nr:DUF2490 domain-containing protein [Acanthopleuribacter pedis]MBO1323245.1 DUF2490 domain-containing protein [Acanthopleuribacter pedis]